MSYSTRRRGIKSHILGVKVPHIHEYRSQYQQTPRPPFRSVRGWVLPNLRYLYLYLYYHHQGIDGRAVVSSNGQFTRLLRSLELRAVSHCAPSMGSETTPPYA